MQPVSTQNPLIQRARQEVLFLAGPLIDRCVEAAVTSLQEAERGGRTVRDAINRASLEPALDIVKSGLALSGI